jgi:tRNA-modifying protein YgfZ
MAHVSPLRDLHHQAEASFLMYGAAGEGAEVVETFGELELEYAALRKGCVLIDQPHRASIRVTGDERIDFLNRMITQELKELRPFNGTRSFWLNRKGRIDADLRVLQLPDEMWFDLDVLVAAKAVETLEAFVFAEDIAFDHATDRMHRLALHGPTAADLLAQVSTHADGPPISDLSEGQACALEIAGTRVIVDRQDTTASPGFELLMAADDVLDVHSALLERGDDHAADKKFRLRQAGWHAFNIARIEAGWPIFNMDFGPDSLPAETGVLDDRVSFRKGCYLGQEVVARMHALGHPKQTLVALRLDLESPTDAQQPTTGAHVLDKADTEKPVGAVTSSTRSPMLGDAVCCFAQVKWKHSQPDTALILDTAAGHVPARVQPQLRFWPTS